MTFPERFTYLMSDFIVEEVFKEMKKSKEKVDLGPYKKARWESNS